MTISFSVIHAITPSLSSLYTWMTAQDWWDHFLQVVSVRSPFSLSCDQDLADASTPHLDYCSLLFIWLFHFLSVFPLRWSKTLLPKPCPCSLCDAVLTQTCIWTSPPSLLACCLLISISLAELISSAKCSASVAYRLAYRRCLLLPPASPALPSLHLLARPPPASIAGALEGGMLLCLAASSSIYLDFHNIHASILKILQIAISF